jgi:hypothetical protein
MRKTAMRRPNPAAMIRQVGLTYSYCCAGGKAGAVAVGVSGFSVEQGPRQNSMPSLLR